MSAKITDLRERVLSAAVEIAQTDGYQWITRAAVADRAEVGVGSINTAFETMIDLKRAVMAHAVDNEILSLIAQGLADGSSIAKSAPADLKQRALAAIL